jgi:hypothetical protein
MSYIGNQPTNIAFQTDTFSGTGSATAFTMSVAPANTTSVLVAITGVLQDPSTYSVSGTTLTFSAAPPTGTSNISVRYLGIPASGVTTTAYRTVTNFTATAGQTSFSTPSYTVGYINVFRNGVYLPTTDYTATTGTTVVLNNAATVGDTITTESFYVSSVINAVAQTNGSSTSQTLINPIITGSTPQVTVYTSGSGTYTVPTNARYLQVRMVGGGGGGAGVGTAGGGTGGTGGTTTFGSSLLTATGGSGGTGTGGSYSSAGGTATGGDINISGGVGGGSNGSTGSLPSGAGGNSPFGGAGPSVASGNNGGATATGYGSGGSGASNSGAVYGGVGGAAGGYLEKTISSPNATYSYTVGAAGTSGTAGTSGSVGGAGGSGVIYITAYF